MRTCEPDKKWRLVQEALESDMLLNDKFLIHVVAVLKGECEDENVQTAVELIQDDEWRDGVAAYILSGAEEERIAASLWLPLAVVKHFGTLYLDRSSFKHKLEFRRYAEYYAKNVCKSDRMKDLLKKGVIEGPESLENYWCMPGESLSISFADMSRKLADMSFMKAITARHAALTEDVTREALKWSANTLRIISDKDNFVDIDARSEDAAMALESVDMTHKPQEIGLKLEDLLH
jgi:hypothetical protein